MSFFAEEGFAVISFNSYRLFLSYSFLSFEKIFQIKFFISEWKTVFYRCQLCSKNSMGILSIALTLLSRFMHFSARKFDDLLRKLTAAFSLSLWPLYIIVRWAISAVYGCSCGFFGVLNDTFEWRELRHPR